jgi:AraC family transcriptional regulator of adaptative response / DNA-3-methyladenine glycosylase II
MEWLESEVCYRALQTRDSRFDGRLHVVHLQISYRPPYDWDAILAFLAARAIAGVEAIENGSYRRVFSDDSALGVIEIRHAPAKDALLTKIQFPGLRTLPAIAARVRSVFDVAADIETIEAHLAKESGLAALIALRPGLRCPGGWDEFEVAVRAILGQQITVEAARQLAGKLVAVCGEPLPGAAGHRLTHAFPTAQRLAAADLSALGMPEARKVTLKALAHAAVAQPKLFEPIGSLEDIIARLRSIRGIGEWTAQYIALRALRHPDAFPTTDVALLRGAALMDGMRWSAAQLSQRAEAWRPWRAYAAQHLWASVAAKGRSGT